MEKKSQEDFHKVKKGGKRVRCSDWWAQIQNIPNFFFL
jgi:hypothetical protein